MAKPSPSSYYSFFDRYISQVPEEDLATAFINQNATTESFLKSISEEKSTYAYGPGKWTIREVLQHVIDTEHIFNYRALCFARGEQAGLPGFEENDYAANSNANQRSWNHLVQDFLLLRQSTTMLYQSFDQSVMNNSGVASNNLVTVASLGFTTLGHYYHHRKILQERYL